MELCLRNQHTQSRHSVPLVEPGGLLLCLWKSFNWAQTGMFKSPFRQYMSMYTCPTTILCCKSHTHTHTQSERGEESP